MRRMFASLWETIQFIFLTAKLTGVGKRSPAEILAIQERRFRRMLRYAYRHSPYYRRRLAGIDLERCRPEELPILTKAEVMDHFDDLVTDRRIKRADVEKFIGDLANLGTYYLGRYVPCHTSGSQGQPVLIVQERTDLMLTFALQLARGHAQPKDWKQYIKRIVRPSRWASFRLQHGFYPSGAAFAYMPAPVRRFARTLRLSLLDPLADNVAKLNAYQPNFLTAYASVLETLAREQTAGRLRLRESGQLEMLTNMSEPLSPTAREMIQAAFGAHVSDHYAMGECMALSVGCPKCPGAHLNADLALLEVVDEHNRPVPPGVRGKKILVTNLYNRVQPFIRYEIGDVVTLSPHPCPCGSNLPHILSVEGRTKDIFWVEVGGQYRELSSMVFLRPLVSCFEMAEFQVVQTERNRFQLRAAPIPGKSLSAEFLYTLVHDALQLEGLADRVQIEVKLVSEIKPDPRSGKMRRMITLVGPPAGVADPTGASAMKVDEPAAAGIS